MTTYDPGAPARLPALLGLAAVFCAGCASMPDMGMGAGPALAVVADRLTAADRDFLVKAAAKGMYELEVSRLAVDRATAAGVRSFAQMMVRERTQANQELIALMSAKGVAPPRGLAADKATKLHRLAALRPSPAFDNGYVRVVGIEDHRTDIAVFERARRQTRDPDLQAWIDKSLFSMRNHLAAAQSLAGTLAG